MMKTKRTFFLMIISFNKNLNLFYLVCAKIFYSFREKNKYNTYNIII